MDTSQPSSTFATPGSLPAIRPASALMGTEFRTLFQQFQHRYPAGSLTAELLQIHNGQYVVRAAIQVDGTVLATGMAAAEQLEQAEDRARQRALEVLGIAVGRSPEPTPSPYEMQVQLERPAPLALNPSVQAPPPPTVAYSPVRTEDIPRYEPEAEVFWTPDESELPDLEPEEPEFSTGWLPSLEPPPPVEVSPTKPSRTKKANSPSPIDPPPGLESPSPRPGRSRSTPTPPLPEPTVPAPLDLSEVIAQTSAEIKRLNWTIEQGRNHLLQTYGKKSRSQLTDDELQDFLHYLQSQPTPGQTPF